MAKVRERSLGVPRPNAPPDAPAIAPPVASALAPPIAPLTRIECEHGDRCGGCPLLAFPYGEQLARKGARLAGATARYSSEAFFDASKVAQVTGASPITGYRTRAKLIVAPGAAVGLFAKGGGHKVVDIPACRVLAPVISAVAEALRQRIRFAEASGGALAPYEQAGKGLLRAVDLREVRDGAEARVLVTLVVERSRATDLAPLEHAARDLMKALPSVIGVAANFHSQVEGRDVPQILGGETRTLAGTARAPDRVGASVHFATFGSFVQAHRGQTERVHAFLAGAVGVSRGTSRGQGPRVLDLYGGSGAIGLALAAGGARVVLVESFSPAAHEAAAGAQAQDLEVDVVCADATAALRALSDRGERFEAAVVNPPRRGTSPEVREALARLAPPVIAYVSCEPETLARDLAHLARLGYRTESLTPFDMIPLTDEVETVAVLRRGATPVPPIVHADDDILVVDKGPHEPTAPDAKWSTSLQARVRLIAGAEHAVPVHWPDAGTSGLAMFVRRPDEAQKWRSALASPTARMIYFALVRGVTPAKGSIARPLREGGELVEARTRYRRASIAGGHSFLRVIPESRPRESRPPSAPQIHTLLRHLAAINHPVLGDERHGHAPSNRYFEEKSGLDRTFLHASRFELMHPDTGEPLVFEAPLAGDLEAVLATLSR